MGKVQVTKKKGSAPRLITLWKRFKGLELVEATAKIDEPLMKEDGVTPLTDANGSPVLATATNNKYKVYAPYHNKPAEFKGEVWQLVKDCYVFSLAVCKLFEDPMFNGVIDAKKFAAALKATETNGEVAARVEELVNEFKVKKQTSDFIETPEF